MVMEKSYNLVYTRSLGIFSPELARPVNIIGCGSTGSFVAETLGKMGFTKFHLWDGDTVEEHNIGCQNFGWEHLKSPKTEALRGVLTARTPVKAEDVTLHTEYVTEDSRLVILPTILAVDSMRARKVIWKKLKGKSPIVIDPRVGGQHVKVITAVNDPESIKYYEESLYSDEQAADLPCTQRNVAYVASVLSGMVCRAMRNFLVNGQVEKEIGMDVELFIPYIKE